MPVEMRDAVRRKGFLGGSVASLLASVLGEAHRVVLFASRSASELQVALLEDAAGRAFVHLLRPAPMIDRAELDRLATELALHDADALVAFGGGAIMDAAKELARPQPLLVLVPATLSGSEHTANVAWWEKSRKIVVRRGFADAVIADPALLVDRLDVLAPGALHAFAHVLATLTVTEEPSPRAIAAAAARDLLPALADGRTDLPARARFQRGAWMAAVGFALTGPRIGPHHFLVHRLSGPGDHARLSTRLLCATLLRTEVYTSALRELEAAVPNAAESADTLAHVWAPLVADAQPVATNGSLPSAFATVAQEMLSAFAAT